MLTKKLMIVFLIVCMGLICVPNVQANDDGWTEVISDPKDSRFSADIKKVYVKDDGGNWSFKVESWKDWDLYRASGMLSLFFNTSGTSDLHD
ncbi:MAG: hypothetical protein PHI40_08665, partial [Caldisericia bacterium]|nr:hypothetical protein [Caldisericia bacterium]